MITRALNRCRSGSRRPRPSRFPKPGFPRGAHAARRAFVSARCPNAGSSGGVGRVTRDLLAAVAMVGGIFLWGGLFVLLAG